MQNEKCVKDEPHSEFTKEEQQEFLKLLNRITPEQREGCQVTQWSPASFFFVRVCFIQAEMPELNPK